MRTLDSSAKGAGHVAPFVQYAQALARLGTIGAARIADQMSTMASVDDAGRALVALALPP